MLRYLVYMLRIRRVEFRIAEIPILAIPLLILLRDTGPLKSFYVWEGIFIFFLLFAFGDMINCLADRDLDAVYKPHLSEAVYGLGVRFVTFQVWVTALIALALSLHLSWILNRWTLIILVAIGLALGAAYSVKPFQIKGRGVAQIFAGNSIWTNGGCDIGGTPYEFLAFHNHRSTNPLNIAHIFVCTCTRMR